MFKDKIALRNAKKAAFDSLVKDLATRIKLDVDEADYLAVMISDPETEHGLIKDEFVIRFSKSLRGPKVHGSLASYSALKDINFLDSNISKLERAIERELETRYGWEAIPAEDF